VARAFVAVGSNIDPSRNVAAAVRLLARRIRIVGFSEVYLTAPETRADQAPFYNLVVEVETDIPPGELKNDVLRAIERKLGRVRTEDKDAPRTIDLDLILYDDLRVETKGLVLPDPQILERSFLAIPLSELSPGLIVPGTGLSLKRIASEFSREGLKPVAGFAALLKKEISQKNQS